MPVAFEGFPRIVERESLKPGRWFVAAEGGRPLICFSTEEGGEDGDRVILTFSSPRPEVLEFAPGPLKDLTGPLSTLEHDVVFAPGLAGHSPQLVAPARRPFRPGTLLRLRNGDLGLGFASPTGALVAVSLATGFRAEGYDLTFDRWTLCLRRGASELLVGAFRPL
jgi:hypothetical protein